MSLFLLALLVCQESQPQSRPADSRPPDSRPTSNPVDQVLPDGNTARAGFVHYFLNHFSGHEPMYFLVGGEAPAAKFQFSFKYRVFNPEGTLAEVFPPITGLHFAYSQTSFWDLSEPSVPFFDTSYRPEVLWSNDDMLPESWKPRGVTGGLQTGFQHESNGKADPDGRSVNTVYLRPMVVFGDREDLFLTVAPTVWHYISQPDSPPLDNYRGHGDLRMVGGWTTGLQLAAIGRLGDQSGKGSLQLDLSYPLRGLGANVDLFLHAQLFTGYGETLLFYDQYDTQFRVGFSLIR
jgi:phospholipase A1